MTQPEKGSVETKPETAAPAATASRPPAQPASGVFLGNSPVPGVTVQDWTSVPGVQAVSPVTKPAKPAALPVPKVTSAFLYVRSIEKSIEFYREALGATLAQKHAQDDGGPATLAIMKLNDFSIMLHVAEESDLDLNESKPGVGIHLQFRVADVDAAYARACNAGYYSRVSDGPIDQEWGWREFAIKDPDGYIWSVYQDKSGGAWT
jgi:uncharacterized glyoxalase superfamily protein PhnB